VEKKLAKPQKHWKTTLSIFKPTIATNATKASKLEFINQPIKTPKIALRTT
jgi:hypothetical protein